MNKKYQPPGQVLFCCPLQPVRYGQMKMQVHFHPDIPGPTPTTPDWCKKLLFVPVQQ